MKKLLFLLLAATASAATLPLYIDTATSLVVSPDAPTTAAGFGITDAIIEPQRDVADGFIGLDADGNAFVAGSVDIIHTSIQPDDHSFELDVNAAGFGDVKAIDIAYITGAIGPGTDEGVILVNIDETLATGGEVFALEVLTTTIGGEEVIAIKTGVGIDPISQDSGVFVDAGSILNLAVDVTVPLSDGGAGNISIFVNDNDTITVGLAIQFAEIEVIIGTGANRNVQPTWEYSTGVGTWAAFTPTDGTNGFRNTGAMLWDPADLAGWVIGTGDEYLVRVTRTRNNVTTTPIVDKIQAAAAIIYSWDKDGAIVADRFSGLLDRVQIGGTGTNATNSTIQFLSSGSITAEEFGRIARIASSVILVDEASDLAGTLDSTMDYFIDGIVDMGSQTIEVPAGGLSITGSTFDISRLISSAAAYSMFTSPVGGSGNVLGRDIAIEVTGAGSEVFDLTADTGNEAIEFARVNWNNCTSIGTITNYRQGLEAGTGRFGGTPNLTLAGTWTGGYFIDTSIVRSLSAGMTGALYQAGAGFVMSSRFRSNQNIDLPANAAFFDFAAANFVNPSTVQLDGCIISRDGVFDANDANIAPNLLPSALVSNWTENNGVNNTFVGGTMTVTAEAATTISIAGTFYTLAGTFTATDLAHFDSPANGQIRHLGNNPHEYALVSDLTIEGTSGNSITIRLRKYDSSTGLSSDIFDQTREIFNLAGARDIAIFTLPALVVLDQNDYVFLQVANNTSTGNVTIENSSFFRVVPR